MPLFKMPELSFRENKRRLLVLKGILSRRYAFKGPDVVQVDMTDRCRSSCILCWTHSPYVKTETHGPLDLDPVFLKDFILQLKSWGTREIYFSGGGEPFEHPRFWEILEYVENNAMDFRIHTNLALLNESDIAALVSYRHLLSFTVSVWAGEPELYSRLHGRTQKTFFTVKNLLRSININKRASLSVKLSAILCSQNLSGINEIADLAEDTGCDMLEFGVMDSNPPYTDSFLPSAEDLRILRTDFLKLVDRIGKLRYKLRISNGDIFLKRISCKGAACGEYDGFLLDTPCVAGWVFLRLRANGDFNPCLKSHRLPVGNLYKDSFSSVWNNEELQNFRQKCLMKRKPEGYFSVIGNGRGENVGCRYICDNWFLNRRLLSAVKLMRFSGVLT